MTYRPSAQLVAANAALAHWLERHPAGQKSPAAIAGVSDDGRQSAAAPVGEEEVQREAELGRGKGK